MARFLVQSGSRGLRAVVEIYERGPDGTAVLVETHGLGASAGFELNAMRFAVVREGEEADGKSIDNWFTTPAPSPGPAPEA